MLSIWILTIIGQFVIAKYDYEYVYEESSEADTQDLYNGHHRLVGAPRSSVDKYPFVVAFAMKNTFRDYASCTGSLITREWIVTAAHCQTTQLPADNLKECVDVTTHSGLYQLNGDAFKCHGLPDGSVAVYVREGAVYIGVDQIPNPKDVQNGHKIRIKFVVRHVNGYHGGGSYGTFGGYDIMLVKLAEPAPADIVTACLPGMNFKDHGLGPAYTGQNQVFLAGYGKYKRRTCLTDQYGASKYHMCEMYDNCKTTPPPQTEECKQFFSSPTTPNTIPEDKEEIVILESQYPIFSKTGVLTSYCYRSESALKDSQGWCKVIDDAADFSARTLVKTESWGFCSRDCFLGESPKNTLRALEEGVDILDDFLCDKFVDASIRQRVAVEPEVLCIGSLKPLKFDAWLKKPGNTYERLTEQEKAERFQHRLQILPGIQKYVHSVGTCNGDSGGPVFVEAPNYGPKRFVVLGVVSGGRGLLGNCGGLNNPTHYVRVKKMVPWIHQILGEDMKDVCVNNSDF